MIQVIHAYISIWIQAAVNHQAILARKPFGFRLTRYFLPSSRNSRPSAKQNGKKMYSTGTPYSDQYMDPEPERSQTYSSQEGVLEEGDVTEEEDEGKSRQHGR